MKFICKVILHNAGIYADAYPEIKRDFENFFNVKPNDNTDNIFDLVLEADSVHELRSEIFKPLRLSAIANGLKYYSLYLKVNEDYAHDFIINTDIDKIRLDKL